MFTVIANTKHVALDRKHVFNVFYHRQINVIANKTFSFVTCFTTSVEFKSGNALLENAFLTSNPRVDCCTGNLCISALAYMGNMAHSLMPHLIMIHVVKSLPAHDGPLRPINLSFVTEIHEAIALFLLKKPLIIRPPGTAVPDGLMFCRRCFFRQPHLRDPSSDRRETLPHDRNLARIAQLGRTTFGSSPKKF